MSGQEVKDRRADEGEGYPDHDGDHIEHRQAGLAPEHAGIVTRLRVRAQEAPQLASSLAVFDQHRRPGSGQFEARHRTAL